MGPTDHFAFGAKLGRETHGIGFDKGTSVIGLTDIGKKTKIFLFTIHCLVKKNGSQSYTPTSFNVRHYWA